MARLYPLDPEVARRITARRRALGLSQNAVALAAGLTEAAVAKYETLRLPVPPDKLIRIERALDEAERKRLVAV